MSIPHDPVFIAGSCHPETIDDSPGVNARLRLAEAIEFIRLRHPDPALSLNRTAAHVQISPFHLSRLFKLQTGLGFAHNVRLIRITSAQRLLETSPLSIKEIAAAVGYSHTNDLDRNFKAVCGLTPTMYRTMLLGRQQSLMNHNNPTQSALAAPWGVTTPTDILTKA